MSGQPSAVGADTGVKPLAIRILDAHFERTWEARENYATRLAQRPDLTRDDIFMDTIRRATDGVEPTWLRQIVAEPFPQRGVEAPVDRVDPAKLR